MRPIFGVVLPLFLPLLSVAATPRPSVAPYDRIGLAAAPSEKAVTRKDTDTMTVTFDASNPNSNSQTITIMQEKLKLTSPTDLISDVSLECALYIDVVVAGAVGKPHSKAKAQVEVWIEIDGVPVPASTSRSPDNGHVAFCSRAIRASLVGLDEQHVLDLYQNSGHTHGFSWPTHNLAAGLHTVVVKARLSTNVTGRGVATARIGKRVLVDLPAKLAKNSSS